MSAENSKEVQARFNAYKRGYRDSLIQYVIEQIMFIIARVGPREPGSPQERAGQDLIAEELARYADDVHLEMFDIHPHTLMGWVVVDAFLCIFSVFFYNFQCRLISFLCILAGTIIMVMEFVLYKEFLDPIFPKRVSQNVVGHIMPKGPVKRRAIFNGHCDSNYEWWFNYLGGGRLLTAVVVVGIVGMLKSLVLQIVLFQEYKSWFAMLELCYLPFYILLLFFTNWNRIAPGANDNLSGVYMAMGVAKYMKDNGIELENTEVMFCLTGSEECGLRGAKDFVKRHRDGVETAFFAFDTMRDLEHMGVYSRDMTGTVQNDLRVCSIMKRAGTLAGLDLPYKTVFFGSSDAAAITQGGMPAACFAAMDPAPASYYHTRTDDTDNMEPIALGYGLDVAIGSLFIFDKEGLSGSE